MPSLLFHHFSWVTGVLWIIWTLLSFLSSCPVTSCLAQDALDTLVLSGSLNTCISLSLDIFTPTFPLSSAFSKQFFTWCYPFTLQFKYHLRSQIFSSYLEGVSLYPQSIWVHSCIPQSNFFLSECLPQWFIFSPHQNGSSISTGNVSGKGVVAVNLYF